ncbi:MAG: isochorismatase family protein [Caldilineaceae bacterium]
MNQFNLTLRRQVLTQDTFGHNHWLVRTEQRTVAAPKTAIVICDMWDCHWSRGASERVEAMVPTMNQVVAAARQQGALIIHAPSEVMNFYTDHPARQRNQALPVVTPPAPLDLADPPLPIDDTDGGSDTGESNWYKAWSRQHAGLFIDEAKDLITDDGTEVYNALHYYGIEQLLIMGVHTNMCVLRRSFAIKQMVRWGVNVALVADLTDTMYNPAQRPYVSHEEGTRLVVEYIEKFWCPTILSKEIAG